MSRETPEWIGKNDDSAIPPRVKDRIFARCGGACQSCPTKLDGINKPEFDHIQALINGGRHAEFNLHTLCKPCHAEKTKADVGEKSRVYQKRASHLGFFAPKTKWQSRGFPSRRPQRTASRPIERRT
jgi:5-methylcytosine-specific restriction endonuclease McrA